MEGNFAVSLFSIAVNNIDLGRIGFENDWMSVEFSFEVQNLWDTPLKISLNFPEQFQLEKQMTIPASSTSKVKGTLSTHMLKSHSGYFFADVSVQNVNNPLNKHKISLKADITHPSIKYCWLKLV